MNNSQITLNDFFGLKEKELTGAQLSAIESGDKMGQIRENLLKKIAKLKWAVALKKVMERMEDILDIGIGDIMINAWIKFGSLSKFLDREKYPPEEVILVPLAEHTIQSEHHPYIEIMLNDKSLAKINFDVNIEIMLEGALLKIQDGKIKEIMTGTCKGEGSLVCEGYEIVKRELKTISLPGTIDLGNGVVIPPLHGITSGE